jgi:predicted MFS family arabinose efflux permease
MSGLRASAAGLLGSSIVARLPQAMLGIALLVHVHGLTGSFAAAGVASGAYAIARAAGAPLVGTFVDRCGQTLALLGTASASAVALMAIAMLGPRAPAMLAMALAAAIGLVTPPVGACARALLPAVISDPAALPAAFTLESTALELTFIFGPPLALGLGALWSTGAALAASGLVQLLATLAFALAPASRNWRPSPQQSGRRGGSLGSPAMRTLVLILVAIGAVFGAVDVAVTATAATLGHGGAAGPLLGIWGLGSLLGGIVATRFGGAPSHARGVVLLVAALAFGHAALLVASGSLIALAGVLLLAGASIAPTTAAIYAMVGRAAPGGTVTAAFAWVMTANSLGASIGAALAGALTQTHGAPAAFALAGVAGAVAVLVAVARMHTLAPRETAPTAELAPAVA